MFWVTVRCIHFVMVKGVLSWCSLFMDGGRLFQNSFYDASILVGLCSSSMPQRYGIYLDGFYASKLLPCVHQHARFGIFTISTCGE